MGRILIQGEEGHAIVDELAPLADEIVIDKPGKSAFYATDLEELLRSHGIKHLLVTGVTTDVCCSATVIAANDRGFDAIVLSDCVASYSPERHMAALAVIKAQGGIFGWVTDSKRVLAALGN
jgi:nicotinamidase-related amidase